MPLAETLHILGLSGLEPPTSRLSGVRSNRLSYKPIFYGITCIPNYAARNACEQVINLLRKFITYFGGHLPSHTVTSAVLSAAWVLTIVFEMGTGVTPKRIATKDFVVP